MEDCIADKKKWITDTLFLDSFGGGQGLNTVTLLYTSNSVKVATIHISHEGKIHSSYEESIMKTRRIYSFYGNCLCGGLNKNYPHRLRHFNTWSPGDRASWRGNRKVHLGGGSTSLQSSFENIILAHPLLPMCG